MPVKSNTPSDRTTINEAAPIQADIPPRTIEMADNAYSLGCDLGSASVKIAVLDQDNNLVHTGFALHRGDVLPVFHTMMDEVLQRFGDKIAYAMVQGSMAKGFASASVANEIAAVVEGARLVFPGCKSIVDIGGESARYIADVDTDNVRFAMNSSCSAGTGSFFEDQMTRLGTRLERYSEYVEQADTIPRMAGRCTVFAKTDIIHRQQEGATTPDILLGLAYAMVRNFKGTIVRKLPVRLPVILSGGVAHNAGVVRALKEILKIDDLRYSDDSPCLGAVGCAVLARQKHIPFDRKRFFPRFASSLLTGLPPLQKTLSTDGLHKIYPLKSGEPVYLGVDIGSTSTNLVLIDNRGRVVDYQYLRTSGEPLAVAQAGIEDIRHRFGRDLDIRAIGTTGSGRNMVGKALGATTIKDEITAQARGARISVPDVDTVFEIGGQDSKFIRLNTGQVSDFQMNKVCAAGTGSFVEEQAERLDIALDDFGELALSGKAPSELGERCTVFIKSQLEKALGEGADKASAAAGICYSIVHNYLHKVVGNKPVGEHICLSGGVAYNDGIVAAFRRYYPDLQVTPYFSVTGALGIAHIAMEEASAKIPAPKATAKEIQENIRLFHQADPYYFSTYTGERSPKKKTIGIPRALMIYKMFPMAYNFFKNLGYNVLLSPETDEEIIRRSQELVEEETCYPVKLILGHMSWLMEQQCDAIFMPSMYTVRHEGSHLTNNYGCVFMQNVAARFAKRLRLEEKGIEFLNPVLEMDMGAPQLAKAMLSIGRRLGHAKPRCAYAMAAGGRALKAFNKKSEEVGKHIQKTLRPDERVLVLITRNYGIADTVLSMGIADQLLQRGYKVITLSHLENAHAVDMSTEHPNQYWPFGAHILSGLQIVRNDPRLFAVYLTNHGCGPDSMLAHQAAEIMGNKPWLTLEVDEHYSPVGLVTRVEAFLSSLDAHKTGSEGRRETDSTFPARFKCGGTEQLSSALPTFILRLFPYSSLTTARLQRQGFDCREMAPTDMESLRLGRSTTRTKEYITFTAQMGDALKCAAANPQPHQLLLPQNGGAEADGQFSRTIRTHLDAIGRNDIVIVSPLMEAMHTDRELWLDALAGDVIMSAPEEMRQELLRDYAQRPVTIESLLDSAQRIGSQTDERPLLLLHGEPNCVFNDRIHGGIFDTLESGHRVTRLPMAEYLLFLWGDNGIDVTGQERDMRLVDQALGRFSPFSPSLDALLQAADSQLGKLAGANGRYRMAKSELATPYASAVIEVVPLYENVASLLNLVEMEESRLPLLRLPVNGEGRERDKLGSFLHFLQKSKERQAATSLQRQTALVR